METINNVATAAARAVGWTNSEEETKQEPISGVNGDTSKGEPFDAGNLDEPKQAEKAEENTSSAPATEAAPKVSGDTTKGQNDTQEPDKPETEPEAAQDFPGDTTKGQNDTREPDKPETDPEAGQQGVDLKEPGPKPLSAVAKEHGGDAGSTENVETKSPEDAEAAEPDEDEDENGVQKKSHGSGTGEQWVKSNGFKADGGNFDASAPGAAKEADRLLEKKGVKREEPPNKVEPSDSLGQTNDDTPEPKEKRSLGDKIKAKLHVH